MNAIETFLDNAPNLPALPALLSRLIQKVNDPDTSADELAKILEADSVLSARILKVANSVFYGMAGKVSNVKHALVVLGFKTIRSMALTIWTQSLEVKNQSQSNYLLLGHMFTHGIATAVASSVVARRISRSLADDGFIAGLMHDIGRIALISAAGEQYSTEVVNPVVEQGVDPTAREREIWGFDHAELGAVLLESFHLPAKLIDCARLHLTPEVDPQENPLLACVCLGNTVAAAMGCRLFVEPPAPHHAVRTAVGVNDAPLFEDLIASCHEQYNNLLSDLV